MNEFLIRYFDISLNTHTVIVGAEDIQSAIRFLVECHICTQSEVITYFEREASEISDSQDRALATASAIQMFKDGHRTFEVVRKIVQFGFSKDQAVEIVKSVSKTYGVDTRELRGPIPESA